MNVRTASSRALFLFVSLFISGFITAHAPAFTHAQATASAADTSGIQSQIDSRNQQISDLQKQIAQYQQQLDTLGAQHQTLQTAIKSIDVSRQQTSTQIQVTQNKIVASNLKLQELSGQISQTQYQIQVDKQSIAQSIREVNDVDQNTMIERIFAAGNISDAWTQADAAFSVNNALRVNANSLAGVTQQLSSQKQDVSVTHDQLSQLSTQLTTQQKQLDANKAVKSQLLSQTKSQESSYQKLIAQKKAEEAAFESEIYQLSQQLKAADTTKVPTSAPGILAWPLESIRITQMFGRTTDSGRLYTSGTHNGVDFAASPGTAVHAALTGTVWQVNQGVVQNCQYGKWVLIKHANGLATLYAHLSEIDVSPGQTVTTGQTIGYSGMTGYATGPHLHLTVYNASSVTFKNYTCNSGGVAYIPIVPTNGYLDPLAYLPS